jgi:hypothetical protein
MSIITYYLKVSIEEVIDLVNASSQIIGVRRAAAKRRNGRKLLVLWTRVVRSYSIQSLKKYLYSGSVLWYKLRNVHAERGS